MRRRLLRLEKKKRHNHLDSWPGYIVRYKDTEIKN